MEEKVFSSESEYGEREEGERERGGGVEEKAFSSESEYGEREEGEGRGVVVWRRRRSVVRVNMVRGKRGKGEGWWCGGEGVQ